MNIQKLSAFAALVISLSIPYISYSQCPTAALTLQTQTAIDNYATDYAGCTVLKVDLTIEDDGTDPIKNLNGLSSLTSIFPGNLAIKNNPMLSDVSGLDNLASILGKFDFTNNDGIFTLNGFSNLEVKNTSTISGNDGLIVLSGFNSFTGGDDLIIKDNGSLALISGLDNLKIDDFLRISNNNSLTNISGLKTNRFVFGINITGNSKLSSCNTPYICDNLDPAVFPEFTFSSNGVNCSSAAEVQAECFVATPVELVNIRADKSGSDVALTWLTASEINNKGFEVHRSGDGRNWEEIGFVEGAGSSYATTEYRFLDEHPMGGSNYYRLKQIDYDGVFEYSPTVIIDIVYKFEKKAVIAFPNPTAGPITLKIKNERQERALIRISDSFGRLVFEERFDAGEMNMNYTKSLQLAPMDMYFIHTQIGNQSSVEKIKVQNLY